MQLIFASSGNNKKDCQNSNIHFHIFSSNSLLYSKLVTWYFQ